MPGFILHMGATVLCAHGGQAQPTTPNLRVMVGGQPTVTMAAPYVVAGCLFNVAGVPTPCVTAQWITAATRVTSNGQPLLLQTSQSICTPTGTPLLPLVVQPRVSAL